MFLFLTVWPLFDNSKKITNHIPNYTNFFLFKKNHEKWIMCVYIFSFKLQCILPYKFYSIPDLFFKRLPWVIDSVYSYSVLYNTFQLQCILPYKCIKFYSIPDLFFKKLPWVIDSV